MYCLTLKLLIHLLFFYRIFNLEKKVVETENPFFCVCCSFCRKKFLLSSLFLSYPWKNINSNFYSWKKRRRENDRCFWSQTKKASKKNPGPVLFSPLIYGCPVSRKSHLFPQKRKKKSLFYSSFPVSICQLRGRKRRKLIEGGKKRKAHALIEEKRLISTL